MRDVETGKFSICLCCWPVEPLAALIAKSALVRVGPMILGPYATPIPATCRLCLQACCANAKVDYDTDFNWLLVPSSTPLPLPLWHCFCHLHHHHSLPLNLSHSLPLPRLGSLSQLSPIFPFLMYKGVCLLGDIRGKPQTHVPWLPGVWHYSDIKMDSFIGFF